MGLGFAAFGAELPELEARCHEHLYYARPTVLAATEDPQGTRVLNLFARDCLYKPILVCRRIGRWGAKCSEALAGFRRLPR